MDMRDFKMMMKDANPPERVCPECFNMGYIITHWNKHGDPQTIQCDCQKNHATGKESPWTREAPKEPGWYFAIYAIGCEPKCVLICRRPISNKLEAKTIDWTSTFSPEFFKYWARHPIQFPPAPEED
jgi:hypothetical protein